MPAPSSCAAIAIRDLRSVCRPRTPSSKPPKYVSSTSTLPVNRSRPGPNHRSPELVQPGPGRLVAAQPQHPLQSEGTGPVLLARQPVHGAKPIHQRLTRVLEDRARRHRRLATTRLALHEHGSHGPEMTAATARALEALRPSQPVQVVPTRLLGVEPSLEIGQTPGILLHSRPCYRLGPPESSKYPLFVNSSFNLALALGVPQAHQPIIERDRFSDLKRGYRSRFGFHCWFPSFGDSPSM